MDFSRLGSRLSVALAWANMQVTSVCETEQVSDV